MPVYRVTASTLEPLTDTSFAKQGMKERGDLQRLLRANISVVAPDVLVIGEEFGEWDDSSRRIDLLAVDRNANLVVIELKRDEAGGHMELQAIRYAAMVSGMTFARAVEVYRAFLAKNGSSQDPQEALLSFLDWSEPREDDFAEDVRIVLVSADFSKEITTSVLWLNERDMDIRCVRLRPYAMGSETLIDAQQVLPLPEAEEYQIKLREKAISRRESVRHNAGEKGATGYWFMNVGEGSDNGRDWEDCSKYGYMLAGGTPNHIQQVRKLEPGAKLVAYVSQHGYVGVGEVLGKAVPVLEFVPPGLTKRLTELPMTGPLDLVRLSDPESTDWCVPVRWERQLKREEAVGKTWKMPFTLGQFRQYDRLANVLTELGVEPPTKPGGRAGTTKFQPLTDHLDALEADAVTLNFAEIEALVGKLPQSAHDYDAYWNPAETHTITHAFLRAGFVKEGVSRQSQQLRLRRNPKEAAATLQRCLTPAAR